MKTEQNEFAKVLMVLGTLFTAAAKQLGIGKVPQAEVADVEPEGAAEPGGDNTEPEGEPEGAAEPTKVVFPAKSGIGDLKKVDIIALFKAMTLVPPKVAEQGKSTLAIIHDLLTGSRKVADTYSRADLYAAADAFGTAHKKVAGDTVKEMRAALKKLDVEIELTAEEPDAPEGAGEPEAPTAGGKKGAVTGKPDDNEPDAPEGDGSGDGAPAGDPTSEKDYDTLAANVIGAEDEIADPGEVKKAINAWLKRGKPQDHARYDKIAVLMKKDEWYKAAVLFYSAFLGLKDGTYEVMDDDTAYQRGEEVWCNGAVLDSTKDESIGRDFASKKCYTVENEQIVPAKDPDVAGKVRIGKKS